LRVVDQWQLTNVTWRLPEAIPLPEAISLDSAQQDADRDRALPAPVQLDE